LLGVLLLSLAWAAPCALESDQYYAWGRELADATDVLNAKVTLEIENELGSVNRGGAGERLSCRQVVGRIVPRFKDFIFHDLELWMTKSALVDRIPATPEEELEYRRRSIYRNTGTFDLGTKMPPSPTVELNGVRTGTDKLSHFFSEGWMYARWYWNARDAGAAVSEAEGRAIRRGILWERTLLGSFASGVFSIGDLEANYQGMLFLVGLCDGGSPALERGADGWRLTEPVDFRRYVTPEWDESYQSPIFGKRRWKRVRPVLQEYCPMLDDPAVVERRDEYALRDRVTVSEQEVARLVRADKLADPRTFDLRTVCAESTRAPAVGPTVASAAPPGR
jgi:hypothetical protein